MKPQDSVALCRKRIAECEGRKGIGVGMAEVEWLLEERQIMAEQQHCKEITERRDKESARELSRGFYDVSVGDGRFVAPEYINVGSLQRIADACELMVRDRQQLQSDKDWYRRNWKERGEEIATLKRSNAALRGVIAKQRTAMEDLVEKYNCMVMQRGQEREETT